MYLAFYTLPLGYSQYVWVQEESAISQLTFRINIRSSSFNTHQAKWQDINPEPEYQLWSGLETAIPVIPTAPQLLGKVLYTVHCQPFVKKFPKSLIFLQPSHFSNTLGKSRYFMLNVSLAKYKKKTLIFPTNSYKRGLIDFTIHSTQGHGTSVAQLIILCKKNISDWN
jgi:hypothetical protein